MSLAEELRKSENTHAREEMFTCKLLYDLKLAAFERGYYLLSYYSDVDHDGFDVVIDDRDTAKKIQLKTVEGMATNSWPIHKSVLRPIPRHWERFGFDLDASPGVEGGVIVTEYSIESGVISVKYLFTDIYIIAAVRLGCIKTHAATKEAAENLMKELPKGTSWEEVNVARGLFVGVSDAHHLLGLMGLHSNYLNSLRLMVIRLASEEWGPKGNTLKEELDKYRSTQVKEAVEYASGLPI